MEKALQLEISAAWEAIRAIAPGFASESATLAEAIRSLPIRGQLPGDRPDKDHVQDAWTVLERLRPDIYRRADDLPAALALLVDELQKLQARLDPPEVIQVARPAARHREFRCDHCDLVFPDLPQALAHAAICETEVDRYVAAYKKAYALGVEARKAGVFRWQVPPHTHEDYRKAWLLGYDGKNMFFGPNGEVCW